MKGQCENNTIYGTKFWQLPNTKGKPLVSDVSSCFLSEPVDVTKYGMLYGGVQNLFNAYQKDFDKGVDRDSGYIYGPSLPRSWFIGAKVSF